jgi:hypothetical protein
MGCPRKNTRAFAKGVVAETAETPSWIRIKKINHFNIAPIQAFLRVLGSR